MNQPKGQRAPALQGSAASDIETPLSDPTGVQGRPFAGPVQDWTSRGAEFDLRPTRASVRAEGEGRAAAGRPDPSGARAALRRLLRTRVPLIEQALFVGVQGKPLNYTQLGQVFRHYVASSGVDERKRVTPHTLRHVFASELLRAGANLRQVHELLGNKHLDSTQRYTRVTAHELRGAVKRLRWVG